MSVVIARDGEEHQWKDGGQVWRGAWHPVSAAPIGTSHGSAAVCFTSSRDVVLVSEDGKIWGLPGGRPVEGEDWRQTLEREVREEACAQIELAVLLGFVAGTCVSGSEQGLTLVRSLWSAVVVLLPWHPLHEISQRLVIRPQAALAQIRSPAGLRPIYRRWFHEASAWASRADRSPM